MAKIEKSDWLQGVFAEMILDQDLLRQPDSGYPLLSEKLKDNLRQTQVFHGEIVRKLGVYLDHALVMKFDHTIGWVPTGSLKSKSEIKSFVLPLSTKVDALFFLKDWLGTPYHWGGMTREGIDCSGLTQLFFWHVHGKLLPKNSRDQRKLGITKKFQDLVNHDLIFCHPLSKPNFHHVAIYFDQLFWHARRSTGVVSQTEEEFLKTVGIEEVKSLI